MLMQKGKWKRKGRQGHEYSELKNGQTGDTDTKKEDK